MSRFIILTNATGNDVLVDIDRVVWAEPDRDLTRIDFHGVGHKMVRQTPHHIMAIIAGEPERDAL